LAAAIVEVMTPSWYELIVVRVMYSHALRRPSGLEGDYHAVYDPVNRLVIGDITDHPHIPAAVGTDT
jgi:hypothetical protein